jgi:hypothetical protein
MVLVERQGFGRSEHHAPVRFAQASAPGRVEKMRIAAADATALGGVPA